MKRERAISYCSPGRATKIIRFSRTEHWNSTIAKWRGARFASVDLKGRKTAQGLAPSALVYLAITRALGPEQGGEPVTDLSQRRSPRNVENRTSRGVLDGILE